LDSHQDGAKKKVCSELLEAVKATIRMLDQTLPTDDHPSNAQRIKRAEKEMAGLKSVIPVLLEMEGTANCKALSRLLNQYKSTVTENGVTIYSSGGAKDMTQNIQLIEDMIRERNAEIF